MPSSDDSSFSRELEGVRAGNPQATTKMAQRYWGRLVALVRPRVRWYGRPAASIDEDDVANAALNSVIGRVRDGKASGIKDRDGFWRMLALVAKRKAGRVVKRWHRRPAPGQPLQSASSVGSRRQSAESLHRERNASG